ncbi:zinc transporter ZntB [Vibrio sp. JPW-9-11-11]|uniref:CorA family divalent cation transporter n=1 Tax=Vibrio sp. JPW-9-11-11 TaxID=1416532 RepID=UPI00159418A3|nr:CorA family divalent cation transporter [Vibrio sp. JPW-9-11-11]NVD08542.1 zinc transporter ZntB [Vibrio sp. JPW-9-11-11]
MSDFIISRWNFSSAKAQLETPDAQPIEANNWYHCQRDQPGLRQWLMENHISEGVIDSLLADDTRPRFESYDDDSFLIILRGINLNQGSEPDDMLSLRILWHQGALISTRKVPSRAVSTLINQLEQGKGPKSLDAVLVSMMNGINRLIADFLTPIEDKINELEGEEQINLDTLNLLHFRLLKLRRYLKPQRYVFEDLISAEVTPLEAQKTQVKNGLDLILRINESIEFYMDQINHQLANVAQRQSEVMNRNTYLFSIIAGIFLPASFFTGLLGVNIGGMPGVDSPTAFTVFCIALVVVSVAEVIILRKLRFI